MNIHFIGIGGIGISALAKFYFFQGHKISGSDIAQTQITNELAEMGVEISIGHRAENIPYNADLIVYTVAVSNDNLEFVMAKKSSIKIQTYAQALGDLTKEYFTIAVSGTHGKSTTTAMLALILEKAGFDPTVIVGTKLKEWGNSNFRLGKSKYLLIEADEYRASFLNYWPKIIVLTNIEAEHLDFYRDINHILETFRGYIGHLSKDGILVINEDDKYSRKLSPRGRPPEGWKGAVIRRVENYSLRQCEANKIKEILKIPGVHNIYNALAALTTARLLGVSDEIIFGALLEFNGTWRRFEYRQTYNGTMIFDDYGHHPTEIKKTLEAAKEFMRAKNMEGALWCVFQPHQLERFNLLFNEFVGAFDVADKIIITDVYRVAGREEENFGILAKQKVIDLMEQLKNRGKEVYFFHLDKELKKKLANNLKVGDLVMLMGAGDIYLFDVNVDI